MVPVNGWYEDGGGGGGLGDRGDMCPVKRGIICGNFTFSGKY